MVRTLFRLQRGAIRLLIALFVLDVVALAGLGRYLQIQWHHMQSPPCADTQNIPVSFQDLCQHYVNNFAAHATEVSAGRYSLVIVGFLVAVILGVTAVAREVELHTVRLAWTTSVPRRTWLQRKVLFNVAVLVVLLIPVAVVNMWFVAVTRPEVGRTIGWSAESWMASRGLYGLGLALVVLLLAMVFGLYVRKQSSTIVLTAVCFLGLGYVLNASATSLASVRHADQSVSFVGHDVYPTVSVVVPPGSLMIDSSLLPLSKWTSSGGRESQQIMQQMNDCINRYPTMNAWYDCQVRLKLHSVTTYIPLAQQPWWQAKILGLCLLATGLLYLVARRKVLRVKA